jgi:hypothetical protein
MKIASSMHSNFWGLHFTIFVHPVCMMFSLSLHLSIDTSIRKFTIQRKMRMHLGTNLSFGTDILLRQTEATASSDLGCPTRFNGAQKASRRQPIISGAELDNKFYIVISHQFFENPSGWVTPTKGTSPQAIGTVELISGFVKMIKP